MVEIKEYKFGMFQIDKARYYDDIKIINGKVKHWLNREGHNLEVKDVKDLIDCDTLIIGTGASGVLKVSGEVIHFLRDKKVTPIIELTDKACKTFNSLFKEGKKVNAILHATC